MIRDVKEVIREADILLEVLDARVPSLTRNNKIENLIVKLGKELILVLNKSDLVPDSFVQKVKEKFEYEFPTVFVSTVKRKGSRALRKAIKLYSPEKEKVLIGVIGYPNTGKSSIINMLRGKHVAKTGPIPGITRGKQLVKLSKRFYLIDTPGIFPVKFTLEDVLRGCIDPNKLEFPEREAYFLVKTIMEKCPSALSIYNIESEDSEEFIKLLSEKMKTDVRSASLKILRDWISGKLRAYWL